MSSATLVHEPPPIPHAPPPKPETRVLALFLKAVIMFFITSLFFLLLGIASLILLPLLLSSLHRHRQNRSSSSRNEGSLDRIKELPQFRFHPKKHPQLGDSDCVVCLEGFKQGQWCRRLICCGHVFHRKCVDVWLVKVDACPLCRARVCVKDDGTDDEADFWASSWRRWSGSSGSSGSSGFRVC